MKDTRLHRLALGHDQLQLLCLRLLQRLLARHRGLRTTAPASFHAFKNLNITLRPRHVYKTATTYKTATAYKTTHKTATMHHMSEASCYTM